MRKFGLIGHPLSHSFSADFFEEKFKREGWTDCSYELFPMSSLKDLSKLLKKEPELVGLNVTSPYKREVMQYLYEMDKEAVDVWSVNTIKIGMDHKRQILKGYNTDAFGFLKSIHNYIEPQHTKALILGTGGAAAAAKFVFKKLDIEVSQVSRQLKFEYLGYDDITEAVIREHKIIVNATPVGTYPNSEIAPKIPFQFITEKHILFDMVYNPAVTQFMKNGQNQGAKTINGLDMLHYQAERAWEIWNE